MQVIAAAEPSDRAQSVSFAMRSAGSHR
jgi:hypothetical protein